MKNLKTSRLLLRTWQKNDLEPFAKMNADPRVMEFFPSILSKRESDLFVKKIQDEFKQRNYGLWAVEIPDHAKFIGFIGLHYQDFKAAFTPCVEIGWRLAYDYWSKGLATEGATTALAYGFEEIGLKEIVSFTSKKNIRSIRLMERLGLTHDQKDDFKHPKLPKDHPLSSHVLYRMTASNWKK